MSDFNFEIVEKIGVLSTNSKGWTKELNKVSFGGRPAKYDIREWDENHEKMSKGLTFTEEEFNKLKELMR